MGRKPSEIAPRQQEDGTDDRADVPDLRTC